MKNELKVFLTAVMFFTRIPCPKWVNHSSDFLNRSSRYFALVGVIVGSAGGMVYYLCSLVFPHSVSVLLSMLSTIWITGAFHEDGLADMFDGFGGGWNREQILDIMKDSRIGTFGVAGLTGVLALKFLSLIHIEPELIPCVLITGHAVSRFLASTLIFTHDYVREDPSSKVKPAATHISTGSLVMNTLFGLLPFLLFRDIWFFLTLIPLVLLRWYLGGFYKKRIGGQTGDCGGALQQLTEVVFYLTFLAYS